MSSPLKYKVKRPWWDPIPPYQLPSGLTVIHTGRRSIQCELGFHKWATETIMGIPMLVCTRCGFRAPKPILEKTVTKRELVRKVQKEMDKQRPMLYDMNASEDERIKAKEKFFVKIFEEVQRKYKKNSAGKWVPKKDKQ